MEKGILFWVTGLAGAGKTTFGNKLFYSLKAKYENSVILDGDILKQIAGKELGYTKDDRRERGLRYSQLCKLLTNQGINVVICTIAMFDEIRLWNRENIEKYVEIYLEVNPEVLKRRNRKGLYSDDRKNVAGKDLIVEYPKKPDFHFIDLEYDSIGLEVNEIIAYAEKMQVEKIQRDKKYWDTYYSKNNMRIRESLFARFVYENYIKNKEAELLEIGCGDGKDSIFFGEKGCKVVGIDSSESTILNLNKGRYTNCDFYCDDFVDADALYEIQFAYCYSRFTMHAIDEIQERKLIKKVHSMLTEGGLFFIEARSINDPKCGEGEKISIYEYINDGHYRRFIDKAVIEGKLKEEGFEIIESEESDKFAPYKDERSVCLRIICKKRKG